MAWRAPCEPSTFAYYADTVRHVKEWAQKHHLDLFHGLGSGLLAQMPRKLLDGVSRHVTLLGRETSLAQEPDGSGHRS